MLNWSIKGDRKTYQPENGGPRGCALGSGRNLRESSVIGLRFVQAGELCPFTSQVALGIAMKDKLSNERITKMARERIRTISWKGKSANAVQFDGSSDSVKAVMDLLGYQRGINNCSTYLSMRNPNDKPEFANRGDWIIQDDRREYVIATNAEIERENAD